MGNKFELVAFEIARRSLDALLAPKLKSDAVQSGFVGQKMGRKGMALIRLKEPENARNSFDDERVRGTAKDLISGRSSKVWRSKRTMPLSWSKCFRSTTSRLPSEAEIVFSTSSG